MTFLNFQTVLAISLLVLLPVATKGTDFPFYNSSSICDEVECGRGSCEASNTTTMNNPLFTCNCQDGWRRTRLTDDEESRLQFLPCIIPNCSLDYTCMPAAPPTPAVPNNMSAFDPCYWTYCGEGTCTKNRTYTHTCECSPGYSNLLNISAFPCYNDCATNSDSCRRLGIRSDTAVTGPSGSGNSNEAMALTMVKFNLMVVLLVSIAVIFYR